MQLSNRLVGLALGLVLLLPVQAVDVITYYHNDALGSPVLATDEAGVVKWSAEYRPFGGVDQSSADEVAAENNNRWYTGHEHDEDIDLTYMQARFYDPEIGRFMSVDPVGFVEGNPSSFGRYTYANNSPYGYVDPDGRDAIITMYHRSKSIHIDIPINYSGLGATRANIKRINNDISARFAGSYSVDGSQWDVTVSVTDPSPIGPVNNIELTTGATSNKRGQGVSFVNSQGNGGEWNVNSPGMKFGEGAHEAGHLMGAGDQYDEVMVDGVRSTTPKPGKDGILMGDLPGIVDSATMQEIIDSPINTTRMIP